MFSPLRSSNGISYLTEVDNDFERKYIALRQKEGYLLSESEVRQLPWATVNKDNWYLRGCSADRFLKYIAKNKREINVLEIGCGNGWFCNYLTQNAHIREIFGLDVNQFELQLAAGAFTSNKKLHWVYGDIFTAKIEPESFDTIILNSSVQYFPDLSRLIIRLKQLLRPDGEIHIMDSPFYKTVEEQKNAFQRSASYYASKGFAEMTSFYTPHLFADMDRFSPEVLYKPSFVRSLARRMRFPVRSQNPFFWFKLMK